MNNFQEVIPVVDFLVDCVAVWTEAGSVMVCKLVWVFGFDWKVGETKNYLGLFDTNSFH